MKTKLFCEIMEKAMAEEYGESNFDTVPYIPDEGGEQKQCLGIFLLEGVHMAVVSARAMYIIWQDDDALFPTDQEKDEALGDFVALMAGMRVAPYMQWHCAYFPYLTQAQIDTEAEAYDDPSIGMPTLQQTAYAELMKELDGMRNVGEIDQHQHHAASEWAREHQDDITEYRRGGMKYNEIADTVLSMVGS